MEHLPSNATGGASIRKSTAGTKFHRALSSRRLSFRFSFVACSLRAGVAELADALDSKSSDRKIVWVRSPPPAFSPDWNNLPRSPQRERFSRFCVHFPASDQSLDMTNELTAPCTCRG